MVVTCENRGGSAQEEEEVVFTRENRVMTASSSSEYRCSGQSELQELPPSSRRGAAATADKLHTASIVVSLSRSIRIGP